MNPVETLLQNEIGLDASSIGPTTIERVTRLRMKSLGLKKVEDYHRLLGSSVVEREQLIESVVVAETWFFRDHDSFLAVTQLAQEWFLNNPVGPLRFLSVPCSTGEEPYTLAMCLIDAQIPPERFVIDAVDISARALARATRAQYGKNSFRGKNLVFRDRHFQQNKDTYILNKSVCDCVHFRQDNLLNGKFLSGSEPYHFIFCRNVLIYFDRPTQTKVIEVLRCKLVKGGILFVGPAEMPIFLNNGFVSANLPMAFACRKVEDASSVSRSERRPRIAKQLKIQPPPLPTTQPPLKANGQSQPKTASAPQPLRESAADLEKARKLADEGKFKEATEICESHIKKNGPSTQAFYLLGLVLDAGGDARAADYYRKALYLEPDHYESLWHMALLLEKKGDIEGARTFKRRAGRVQKKA